jgi:hypothetical protein
MKIKELNPRITCADGVSLSVQANRHARCTPQIDCLEAWTDYIEVDVGFIKDQFGEPFTPPAEWNQYGDRFNPCYFYAYIPTRMVKAFIASHGGEKTS